MKSVEPEVYLLAKPQLDYDEVARYLREVGGESWLERLDRGDLDSHLNDPQNLAEFAGRLCYRSWEPGLNPNVTRVRTDQTEYLQNILASLHGSVLEHVSFSFALHNVSRVCCYDSDTEVLTDRGWVPWPKIEGDETFATLNPVTRELEYQQATEVFHADYDGPMYRVASEQVDLLVTPNHRMWIRRFDTQAARRGEQDFQVEFAEDILHKRVQYQKSAVWQGHTPERVEIPATTRSYVRSDTGTEVERDYEGASFPTLPFARFLGYFIAEGSINGHQIVIAQNRGPMLEKIRATIEEMGLKAYVPETGHGTVRTSCVALRDFLAVLGHCHEKYVPEMVHGWGPEAIAEFLDAMVEGDGTEHKTSGHRVIYTVSPQLADDLQVLAIKAGLSANVRVDDRVGLERVLPSGQRFNNLRACYVVSLLTKRLTPLVNTGRKVPSRYWNEDGYNDRIEQYTGQIHCVKVPNGLLWVRRNGKPVVSGNTHELIRHRPGVAISQESLRFVRLDELPFWFPEWAQEDAELMEKATALLEQMEQFQGWMAGHFGLDAEGVPFKEKKHRTSFMRRFAPEGVATGLVWTANVRTLRHTLEARTAEGAEEEIRLLFNKIGEVLKAEAPALFGDYEVVDGAWTPRWRKV
ncbi:thymidylate synthase Thy1 [Actinocorallia herbida]|uniref:Thymidylate synthase Thy1 n=1 Tax=Actinocorallia herbida TaxID=58109 RepID=A0A3N1D434_9ACTN|nr:thymidylate synthase Thy1 [Actinocorallia herbida]